MSEKRFLSINFIVKELLLLLLQHPSFQKDKRWETLTVRSVRFWCYGSQLEQTINDFTEQVLHHACKVIIEGLGCEDEKVDVRLPLVIGGGENEVKDSEGGMVIKVMRLSGSERWTPTPIIYFKADVLADWNAFREDPIPKESTIQKEYAIRCLEKRVAQIEVKSCKSCPHLSPGFLSEPDECGYFKEAYKWSIPGSGIPDWCPLPEKK